MSFILKNPFYTGIIIEKNKTIHYHKGLPHNNDGPAVIYENGAKEWLCHGLLHRLDGPAVIKRNGIEWYLNGVYYGCNDEYNLESWSKIVNLQILK